MPTDAPRYRPPHPDPGSERSAIDNVGWALFTGLIAIATAIAERPIARPYQGCIHAPDGKLIRS